MKPVNPTRQQPNNPPKNPPKNPDSQQPTTPVAAHVTFNKLDTGNPNNLTRTDGQSKPKLKIAIALLGLIAILGLVNISIGKYETHLATGETVLLALAPVDPRGFMQGDYMALRYALSDDILAEIRKAKKAKGGDAVNQRDYNYNVDSIAIIKKDAQGVGHLVRLIPSNTLANQTLLADEMPLYYRVRKGRIKLATNAFFFQEGHADAFEVAKYGLFRVNEKGEPLLTNMVNDKFEVIVGVDMAANIAQTNDDVDRE